MKLILACLLAVLPLLGCASTAADRHDGARNTLDQTNELSDALQKSKQQVQTTLTALERLPNSGTNLAGDFRDLSKQIRRMNDTADDVAEQRGAMRQQFAKYQEHWYGDMIELDNATLRQAAQERLEVVRQDFDALDPAYRDLQGAYDPFLAHLDEIRTYLANDTTMPAVRKMVPTFEEARQSAADLRTAMDQLLIELRQFNESLKPETSGQGEQPAS